MAERTSSFVFEGRDFDPATGSLRLRYACEDGPSFEELFSFPAPAGSLDSARRAAAERAADLLFWLAGVSYYKARAPERLVFRTGAPDPASAAFLTSAYRHGLGEFFFRNGLDPGRPLVFDEDPKAVPAPVALPRTGRALVPIGGGKDSIVTLETLKRAGKDIALFALGTAAPLQATADRAERPLLRATRRIAPALLEMNRAGALNGHVPITGIVSAAAVLTAILHGFDAIVFSNEASANAPNAQIDGVEINHQYSKSLAFERAFASQLARSVTPSLRCFSLLRPLHETAIAQRFAALTGYHTVFRSCNAAFRLDESRRASGWCGACPKCRFVFLALAPFLERAALVRIFGPDLLDDPAQTEGFAALAGLDALKPFDCVGTVEESATLLATLAARPAWANAAVLQALAPRLHPPGPALDARFAALLRPDGDHAMPEDFRRLLDAPF